LATKVRQVLKRLVKLPLQLKATSNLVKPILLPSLDKVHPRMAVVKMARTIQRNATRNLKRNRYLMLSLMA
jgi:hypothetical protein